jgi:hypothetical protein
MVETNLKIISDLKSFLEIIVKEMAIKKHFTRKSTDFIRDRKLTLEKTIFLIFNFLRRSLTIELDEFFATINCPSSTKGAFSLQRGKLLPEFFKFWNYLFANSFYHHYQDKLKSWRGYLLLAIDGSTEYLFNKPEIVSYFGTHTNQHKNVKVPMARVMKIYDVLNEIILWGDLYPISKSEQQIMNENIKLLPVNSLSLYDRGFPSYTLIYLLENQERPRHFVMRCRTNSWKEIKAFLSSSRQSKIVKLRPNQNAIAELRKYGYKITSNTEVEVKLIKVLLKTGETEILITNLFEADISIDDFKQLYAMRWGIEVAYGKLKNQLQTEIFSGHRVLCIQQDYYASIFIMNLQSIIKKQCEPFVDEISQKRKYDYQVNNNISWAKMKNNIIKLFMENNPKQILLSLQNTFIKNLEPIRPNRSLPRTRKSKKLLGKYQTFTNYRRAI